MDTPIDTALCLEAWLNISLLWCTQALTRNIEGALKKLLTPPFLLIPTKTLGNEKLRTRWVKSPKAGEISQDVEGSFW